MKQIKKLLLIGIFLFCILPSIAQDKQPNTLKNHDIGQSWSASLKKFKKKAAAANIIFTFPKGFKEIKAPDNEDFSFDYAMELPGKDFEIWFLVKSQKENWASYQRTLNDKNTRLANPDSLYLGLGTANAIAFTGGRDYFTRSIPQRVAARYNADAGKSYLLTLLDMPITKHYKYALLITLQKDHMGTILAVCFSNEKGPEFFNNMNKASNCIKFEP
ncbi:hypothetical protein [Mucilaginibacter segetis]|uniref:DUF4251 domain-containing protein n=1 Tax=Mucilaginibacter segetis TaxID=2793071 RepID=A0A934PVR4_9SPHI|nr:hypothetical protein [Mucilaginibacter segetis]MBK0380431.1 hypothetical protein [Mucilaginibacter segetis]